MTFLKTCSIHIFMMRIPLSSTLLYLFLLQCTSTSIAHSLKFVTTVLQIGVLLCGGLGDQLLSVGDKRVTLWKY